MFSEILGGPSIGCSREFDRNDHLLLVLPLLPQHDETLYARRASRLQQGTYDHLRYLRPVNNLLWPSNLSQFHAGDRLFLFLASSARQVVTVWQESALSCSRTYADV